MGFVEIARGYETATGETVVLSDDELATLPQRTSRSIDVISFLPANAFDPIQLDRSYYVEPEPQAAKAYRLLRDALQKLGRGVRPTAHGAAAAAAARRDAASWWARTREIGRSKTEWYGASPLSTPERVDAATPMVPSPRFMAAKCLRWASLIRR
jgi:hypothetical protein